MTKPVSQTGSVRNKRLSFYALYLHKPALAYSHFRYYVKKCIILHKYLFIQLFHLIFVSKVQYIAPMDYNMIKERRAILGLTQQDLADYTGLSVRFIKSVEAGKGNPSIGSLDKIAQVLGLEIVIRVKENNV